MHGPQNHTLKTYFRQGLLTLSPGGYILPLILISFLIYFVVKSHQIHEFRGVHNYERFVLQICLIIIIFSPHPCKLVLFSLYPSQFCQKFSLNSPMFIDEIGMIFPPEIYIYECRVNSTKLYLQKIIQGKCPFTLIQSSSAQPQLISADPQLILRCKPIITSNPTEVKQGYSVEIGAELGL